MYKFYWSNLQKSQTSPNGNGVQSTSTSNATMAADSQLVWTRQNATNTATPMSGNNPEPLPARGGRPTTVRVTSPMGERHAMAAAVASPPTSHMSQKSEKSSSQHHTPTGSHRVLLKLRRGAQAARPKSVHGVEQLMTSPENRFDRLNVSSDDSPSILETLASLRTGELPSKSGKKQGMSTSKSMHHFYSRTWTEKTLQRYQHNYENVYNNDNNNDDNPVYENVYFRQGDPNCDNLVIGQMMQSPRTAARMRQIQLQQQQQSSPDFYRPFEPPPEPNRSVPPVPPDRKCRNSPKGCSSSKPLYRSKSCERPKMKDAMRDTFRISSDKIQNNFSRLSSNLSDKISSNVMNRFSGGAGSVSSSSRMSTGSTDVSSTTSTSNVENQNSLLQAVAMKAIPCVDIQVRSTSSVCLIKAFLQSLSGHICHC